MLKAEAAGIARGSSRVQAALVGTLSPALSTGRARSAFITESVSLSVNEISSQPCHGLKPENTLENI